MQRDRELERDDDPARFRARVGKRVRHKPAKQLSGTPVRINDDASLEAEADAMGARAMGHKPVEKPK